jgi:hypothetical protein
VSHLDPATLLDYWTRDLSPVELESVEAHLFACDVCTTEAERFARIAGAFRSFLPPAITGAQLDDLKAKGIAIEENSFTPGTRTTVTFGSQVDLLIHHLTGLDLASAERVELTVRSASAGLVHHDPFAPFDAARGEVLIACQKHFAAFPSDIVFDVDVHRASGRPVRSTYEMPHVFAFSPPGRSA